MDGVGALVNAVLSVGTLALATDHRNGVIEQLCDSLTKWSHQEFRWGYRLGRAM
jgi:hypothetical protein